MHCPRFLVFSLLLLAGVLQHLSAKEFSSDEFGFAFELPDGWTIQQNTPAVFMASTADRSKSFVVFVRPMPDFYALSDVDGADFERGLGVQGFTVDQREMTRIGDVPFYSVRAVGSDPRSSGALHTWTALGYANHKAYVFGGMKLDGDPTTDDEIMTSIRSFHLLGTPEVPTAVRPIPVDWEHRSFAYKLGYWVGWLSRQLWVWLLAIGLLVGIGLIIAHLLKPKTWQYGRRGKPRRWF